MRHYSEGRTELAFYAMKIVSATGDVGATYNRKIVTVIEMELRVSEGYETERYRTRERDILSTCKRCRHVEK